MLTKSSDHYIFHFHENSRAHEDIDEIMRKQEVCYAHICRTLDVSMSDKMNYYLCDSPEDVGRIYGDNEACNAFTDYPQSIYAVYNEELKCMGYHEDVHLIAYCRIARPKYNFIREGLAMYFDKMWLGISNHVWTRYYIEQGIIDKLDKLFDYDTFHRTGYMVTYPVSGAFTEYLVMTYGMDAFKRLYQSLDDKELDAFIDIYDQSLEMLAENFKAYLMEIRIDDYLYEVIQKKKTS